MNADADAVLDSRYHWCNSSRMTCVNVVNYDSAGRAEERFTCEDVLGDDLHLHLQGMLGGVGDLSGDMGDLADEHWGHELRLLHPNQSSHTVFLHTTMKAKKKVTIKLKT